MKERGAAMIPTEDIMPIVKIQSLHQLNVTPIADTLVGAAVIIFVWICMTVLICVLRL